MLQFMYFVDLIVYMFHTKFHSLFEEMQILTFLARNYISIYLCVVLEYIYMLFLSVH